MSKILEWMDQLEALTSERDALRSENEQLKMEKKELGNMSQRLVQKERYYIWKPLNESELFARNIKVGVTMFIDQMLKWYPEVFPEFADEKARDKFINNLMQSISAEKRIWMKGDTEVPIKDMAASCASLGLVYDNKIQSMFFVCNEVKKGLGNMKMAQVH